MASTTRTQKSKAGKATPPPQSVVEAAETVVRHYVADRRCRKDFVDRTMDGICHVINPYDVAIVVRLAPGLPPVAIDIYGTVPELDGVPGLGRVELPDDDDQGDD